MQKTSDQSHQNQKIIKFTWLKKNLSSVSHMQDCELACNELSFIWWQLCTLVLSIEFTMYQEVCEF